MFDFQNKMMGLVVSLGLAISAAAQTQPPVVPHLAPLLPRDQEIASAESAAPPGVAKNAAVYVLESNGYSKVRDGSNGFTCLVERDNSLSFEPICYDAEGSETLIPAVLRRAELRRQGKSEAEVDADVAGGFSDGRFRAPRRPGIAYMLSSENRVYDEKSGKTAPLPPHVMFYAPYLRNSDFGFQGRDPAGRLPFVVQEGQPDAFIIVTVRDAADPSPHSHRE